MTGSLDYKAIENLRTRAYVAEMPPVQAAETVAGFVMRMASMAVDARSMANTRHSLATSGLDHQACDEYLVHVSEIIQEEFRKTFGHEMIWKEPE